MGLNIKNEDNGLMSEINMTPFIDIMLVLLIIFVATVTSIVGGITVELPSSKSAPEHTKQNEQLVISILKNGSVMINDQQVTTKADLSNYLKKTQNDTPVAIKAEKSVEYNKVVEILDLLAFYNLSNITLLTAMEN